jgi:sulfoxide reductase heme-binding subunit YedZ
MVAGMLVIGITSPEATVKLIRLSVQLASPWIYIAFVTSALTTLFPNAFSKWLLRNRRYTGLSFAAGFGWQAVFIAVLLTLYPAHYWDDLHKASDLLGRSLSYIFLLALSRYLVLLGGDLGELCRAGPESKCKDNRCCLCFSRFAGTYFAARCQY